MSNAVSRFTKAVFLGSKDYFCDTWHDYLVIRLEKYYGNLFAKNSTTNKGLFRIYTWKEGSLKYYIKQRLTSLTKRAKNEKSMVVH